MIQKTEQLDAETVLDVTWGKLVALFLLDLTCSRA